MPVKILAKGIPLDGRTGVLTLRASVELVSWDLVLTELPQHLSRGGTGTLSVAVALVSEVQAHEDFPWNCGLGSWESPQ